MNLNQAFFCHEEARDDTKTDPSGLGSEPAIDSGRFLLRHFVPLRGKNPGAW